MTFFRRHWYDVGAIVAVGAVVWLVLGWQDMGVLHAHGLASLWDWVFGVAYMLAFIYVGLIKMNFTWLTDPNSPYPFADEEMRRFNVPEKLKRLAAR